MSSNKTTKQSKKEEKKLALKREADKKVFDEMFILVGCLWTSSKELESRSEELKNMEPSKATKTTLVTKAAKMLKKRYEHGRDVFGYDKSNYKYHLLEIETYIATPLEVEDFWDGMDFEDEE